MKIVEIEKKENGGHRNQTGEFKTIPNGWAVIPEGMKLKNFPFGDVTAKDIDGVMTVTKWKAGTMPEPQPEVDTGAEQTPTPRDDMNAMLIDHEYRLTLIELGVTE